ncbi:MAG TPA: sugar ABC transporter substrate-binding protein [Roseiarcus sp.]|jgi:ribose transport system substrate-binding protein|nr:sugar ABC transporter substrate-binding protein [Roseiarcus sp.]
MADGKLMDFDGQPRRGRSAARRTVVLGLVSSAVLSALPPAALADKLSCLPVQHMKETSDTPPANKKIGVSVAYLKVPFYANFKTGLEDGAKQFGFTYDLRDGNSGDVATELANLQNFVADKKDLILLTPSGQGIIPGIKQVNDAKIPLIEVNNRAGFGQSGVDVLTYVGADDVEFGRLQGKLLDQAFGGKKARVAYVMGFAGTSPQILRAKGWDEFRAKNPQYEEVARVTDDFDAAKALAVVQDLLSRFPKGQLDAIILQGPEASAAVDFAARSGRDEIKFIVGDYPEDVRQLIYDGKIFGTVDQDPYPQAYNAMKMAWLHFNGKDAEILKPYYLPLPLVTKENAEKTPAAWGC